MGTLPQAGNRASVGNQGRVHGGDRLPAIAVFLWLLPHFAIPAGPTYRPPAAGLFLLLWAVFAIARPQLIRLRLSDPGHLRFTIAVFFLYCVFSAVYGFWNLDNEQRLVLRLTTGDVEYLRVAAERLLQLLLVIIAFEVVRHTRHASRDLMRWWLQGMVFAVALHILTYAMTDDVLAQRAASFNEGNLAGLYYLLSLLLALEHRRSASKAAGTRYVAAALVGILLCRSSAAIMLLGLLLSIRFVMLARPGWSRIRRAVAMFVIVPAFSIAMTSAGLDFGIREKLFEEEVTANSFSRIDRLESINAAIQLFLDSPTLGQGLQSYGFLSNDLLSGPLASMYDASYRRIPNNTYAELAAELGMIGLALFVMFVGSLVSLAWRRGKVGRRHWLLGIVSILMYLNAFPTYTVVFIWVYLGLVVKRVTVEQDLSAVPPPFPPRPRARRLRAPMTANL